MPDYIVRLNQPVKGLPVEFTVAAVSEYEIRARLAKLHFTDFTVTLVDPRDAPLFPASDPRPTPHSSTSTRPHSQALEVLRSPAPPRRRRLHQTDHPIALPEPRSGATAVAGRRQPPENDPSVPEP